MTFAVLHYDRNPVLAQRRVLYIYVILLLICCAVTKVQTFVICPQA